MLHLTSRRAFSVVDDLQRWEWFALTSNARRERKANGQRTSKWPNGPSLWPMLRNATVSEEDNHARFCSPAFRNRFHWWNG